MHVAIVGAGALGVLHGVLLAARAGEDVTFVVRPARVSETTPFVLEAVRGGKRETIEAPRRAAVVPGDADVVLLAVGTEDLDGVREALGSSEAPIVVLTPMMPEDWRRVRSAFGERVLAAMPGVVAYVREDGVVRAWFPPRPTLVDEPRAGANGVAVHALVRSLREAGLPVDLQLGVHETNPATTVGFIGIAMAISLAGSVAGLVEDEELLALAVRSAHEGREIGHRIGRADPLAAIGAAVVTPLALRLFFAGLRRFSPEAVFYAEEHFGRKLRRQHVVMAREIAELAAAKGAPSGAYAELARRLDVASSG